MSFQTEYFDAQLRKNKPHLTENSIKTYISVYRTIGKKIAVDITDINDFIKHKNQIMEYLDDLTPTMKKSRIAAILSLLGKAKEDSDDDFKQALKYYTTKMNQAIDEYKITENDQELSEKQKQNFVSWKEVGETWRKMHKLVQPLWKVEMENVSHEIWDILFHYVVISLYYLMPPRRSQDFIFCKIRNFNTGPSSRENYIQKVKKDTYQFVFNNYKNSTRLGRQVIEIPNELKKVLVKWMNINKTDWLLPNKNGNVSNPNKMNQYLRNIFRKDVGASLLRHSYMTEFYGNVNLDKLQADTQMMGSTDIKTMLQYVSKEHSEKKEE
jgi:hypothetical protein